MGEIIFFQRMSFKRTYREYCSQLAGAVLMTERVQLYEAGHNGKCMYDSQRAPTWRVTGGGGAFRAIWAVLNQLHSSTVMLYA